MALGGGSFTTQNKELPGSYINFISMMAASATLSNRGTATVPLELDWGVDGDIFEVSNEDFQKNTMKIFGYPYDHEKMKGLRDLFIGTKTLFAYRLNGGGEKASNTYATALYSGIRGNDLKIVIQTNVDDETKYDVITYLGTIKVDTQTVAKASELVVNDYVAFKTDAALAVTASTPLEGGTNGEITGDSWSAYATAIEPYSYNVMGIPSTEENIKNMFASFNKRMRDEMGVKFQLVLYDYAKADFLGVISVENKTTDDGWSAASLVYWVTGVEAGCEVNKSCENMKYDGEFTVDTKYTQTQLKQFIKEGKFVLHRVYSDIRVLMDINTMVTTTDTCGDVFKDNQTIRVIDQLANDDAVLFNTKYLGLVPNTKSGRVSLWSDLVKIRQSLQDMGAIENFADSDVTVAQGATKKSVVVTGGIQVVNTMNKLYMTTTVQ